LPYATGSTGLAITVRGSSRRIMIMRFRPANIRLINRRLKLPRLLLALSSRKRKDNYKNIPTDFAVLTRSLHIRAKRSSSIVCGTLERIGTGKRVRFHEYLSFRAAVKTDAGTAAAAHTDESKVRFARYSPGTRKIESPPMRIPNRG
jgi:hypothetical protein